MGTPQLCIFTFPFTKGLLSPQEHAAAPLGLALIQLDTGRGVTEGDRSSWQVWGSQEGGKKRGQASLGKAPEEGSPNLRGFTKPRVEPWHPRQRGEPV